MKTRIITSALAVVAAFASTAQGQSFVPLVGFEGATPLANVPAAPPLPAVAIRTLGDVGGIAGSTFGLSGTQGTQFALLSTFSNGGGNYSPGSPFFGGPGAAAGAGSVWSFMFSGVANPLSGMNVVAGSVITFDLNMTAGDTIRFDIRFFTSEPISGGNADFAFVGVRQGAASTLAQFMPLGQPDGSLVAAPFTVAEFDLTSPSWNQFTFTAAATASYRFGFGIADVGAESTQSGLGIDNVGYAVPEPGTWMFLLGAGAVLGLGGRRFRGKNPA